MEKIALDKVVVKKEKRGGDMIQKATATIYRTNTIATTSNRASSHLCMV
jgi:hypothetical protein